MSRRPRRSHSPTLKAKVAMAVIKGDKTLVQLAKEFGVHPNQIARWKTQIQENAAEAFRGEPKEPPVDVKALQAKIGELTLENDFLEGALTKAGLLSARK